MIEDQARAILSNFTFPAHHFKSIKDRDLIAKKAAIAYCSTLIDELQAMQDHLGVSLEDYKFLVSKVRSHITTL